ncbi:MAG: hypothetical protein AAF725_09290 [Acidobacteriota bacterium]
MRRALLSILALGLLALFLAPRASGAEPDRLLYEGSFIWNHDREEEPLAASFERRVDGSFTVEFTFRYGRECTYVGSARGSLGTGRIQGKVSDERDTQQLRAYTFQGAFRDGVLSGTHSDVSQGEPRPTGTFTLRPRATPPPEELEPDGG